MIYASIDLETTGLDRVKHNIVEFGCVIDDTEKPDVPIQDLPTFHCYNVMDEYVGSPFALSMHPTIFRRIADKEKGYQYCYHGKIGKAFREFLDGIKFRQEEHGRIYLNCAGKNFASFDLPFIQNHTDIDKHNIRIRHRIIDPGSLYMLPEDDAVPGTEECLKRAGIGGSSEHTAIADARDVILLIRKYYIGKKFMENLAHKFLDSQECK